MTIAVIIILAIGAVAFIRAAITGSSPLAWLQGLVQGGGEPA